MFLTDRDKSITLVCVHPDYPNRIFDFNQECIASITWIGLQQSPARLTKTQETVLKTPQ